MYIFIPFANNNEKNTIKGKHFLSFLEMCVSRSDLFSLNITPRYWGKYTRLSRALKPYHISTIDTQKWFGYNYNNVPYEELRINMYQNIYKSTPEVIAIIRKSIKEIFLTASLIHSQISQLKMLMISVFLRMGKLSWGRFHTKECSVWTAMSSL